MLKMLKTRGIRERERERDGNGEKRGKNPKKFIKNKNPENARIEWQHHLKR